jgi:hypothetical protein
VTVERRAAEAVRVEAARPATVGRPRGESVPVDLWEGGARVTLIGHETFAAPLRAIEGLPPDIVQTGVAYGAIMEQLAGSAPGAMQGASSGTGAGCEGAVDRRIRLAEMAALAHHVLGRMDGMAPQRVRRDGRVDQRVPITARELVDMVCVSEMSLSAVLTRRGWSMVRDGRQIVPNRARETALLLLLLALREVQMAWGGGVVSGRGAGMVAVRLGEGGISGQQVERALDERGALVDVGRKKGA